MAKGFANSSSMRQLHAASGWLSEALYFSSISVNVGAVDGSNGASSGKGWVLVDCWALVKSSVKVSGSVLIMGSLPFNVTTRFIRNGSMNG
jgi:hypothetical protein